MADDTSDDSGLDIETMTFLDGSDISDPDAALYLMVEGVYSEGLDLGGDARMIRYNYTLQMSVSGIFICPSYLGIAIYADSNFFDEQKGPLEWGSVVAAIKGIFGEDYEFTALSERFGVIDIPIVDNEGNLPDFGKLYEVSEDIFAEISSQATASSSGEA